MKKITYSGPGHQKMTTFREGPVKISTGWVDPEDLPAEEEKAIQKLKQETAPPKQKYEFDF